MEHQDGLSPSLKSRPNPWIFGMFPKLKEKLKLSGYHFEDMGEMKETVTNTLDTLTLKDNKGEGDLYRKCIVCYRKLCTVVVS